jgi:hypothetical protein
LIPKIQRGPEEGAGESERREKGVAPGEHEHHSIRRRDVGRSYRDSAKIGCMALFMLLAVLLLVVALIAIFAFPPTKWVKRSAKDDK